MTETLRYYWQRLAPFIGVYVLFELIELVILLFLGVNQPADGDIQEAILSFIDENTACLLFTLLPYLLYLAVLPSDFHGGRWDKRVTVVLFSLFCLINWLEELVEIVSGDSFHLLTRDFIMAPAAAWQEMLDLPYCECWAGILLVELVVTIYFLGKRLMPQTRVPHYILRLAAPAIAAGAAFLMVYQAKAVDEIADAPALYDDGLFHIFKWIYDLTAVPDIVQIYALPCICLGALFVIIISVCMLLRQNFPILNRYLTLPRTPFGNLLPMLLALLACVLIIRLFSLGIYPLMDTTEARYGEMARKMVETGNWLQPQFEYGVPFWGKPPLSFWGSAGTMVLCGINEFGARLAPYLATLGIGLCFLLWPFQGRKAEKAVAAIIVLFTSAMGFVSAGAVMTDAFLAVGTTLSMISFYRAMTAEAPGRLWGYLFFLGLVIGLLSKGPLALVVCGLPVFIWVLWQKQWLNLWKRIPWISGTLLMLLLTVPWYIAAEQATPGFLRYFIIGEHIERFLVKGWEGDLYGKGHSRAIGTIWLYAVEMFLPWVLLVPFLIRRNCVSAIRTPENSFLWCWALSTPLFFTMARNILPAYILPAVPAFCILLIRQLWHLYEQERRDYRQFLFAAVPVLIILALFGIGKGFDHIQYRCQKELLSHWDEHAPLYYVDDKVPYSAQFYSAGRAEILTKDIEHVRHGEYLAVHRSKYYIITRPDAWELIAQDGSWRLYRKR